MFEVPEGEVEATAKLVQKVMEGAADPVVKLKVPLTAAASWALNWAEAH